MSKNVRDYSRFVSFAITIESLMYIPNVSFNSLNFAFCFLGKATKIRLAKETRMDLRSIPLKKKQRQESKRTQNKLKEYQYKLYGKCLSCKTPIPSCGIQCPNCGFTET